MLNTIVESKNNFYHQIKFYTNILLKNFKAGTLKEITPKYIITKLVKLKHNFKYKVLRYFTTLYQPSVSF